MQQNFQIGLASLRCSKKASTNTRQESHREVGCMRSGVWSWG